MTGLAVWHAGAERAHQHAFQRLLRTGDVVIDVGANWGQHSLLFSRLVGNSGKVIAAEPYPPVFAELQWHLEANRIRNVTALPVAISDYNGTETFVAGENFSTGSLCAAAPGQRESLRVTTQTLDELAAALGLNALSLVKIDVEGAEGRVLQGAELVVAKFRPLFVIDLHTPEQDLIVAQWLTRRGYCLHRLSGQAIRRSDLGWPHRDGVWGSILACAKS